MSKRRFIISMVLWILLVSVYVYSATIKERNVNSKQVSFTLHAGDKVYVFNKEAVKLRIYGAPEGTKKYYLKVPVGKTFSGTWTLK